MKLEELCKEVLAKAESASGRPWDLQIHSKELGDTNCSIEGPEFFDDNGNDFWTVASRIERISNGEYLVTSANNADKMARIIHILVKEAKGVLWIGECKCDPAYTERGRCEPNSKCGELDGLKEALQRAEEIANEP